MTTIGRDLRITSRVSAQVANAKNARSEPPPYARRNEVVIKPNADGAQVPAPYSAQAIARTFLEKGEYHFDHVGPAFVKRNDHFIEVYDRSDRHVKISFEGEILEIEVEHGDLEEFLSKARFATR